MLKNKTVLLPGRLVLTVELGQMPHGVWCFANGFYVIWKSSRATVCWGMSLVLAWIVQVTQVIAKLRCEPGSSRSGLVMILPKKCFKEHNCDTRSLTWPTGEWKPRTAAIVLICVMPVPIQNKVLCSPSGQWGRKLHLQKENCLASRQQMKWNSDLRVYISCCLDQHCPIAVDGSCSETEKNSSRYI